MSDFKPWLRGEKIWLRPVEMEDAHLWVTATNDSYVAHFTGYTLPLSLDMAEQLFKNDVIANYGKSSYSFTICPLGENKGIGLIVLYHVDKINSNAEFGMFIVGDENRGKGYGTDAIYTILDFGFDELPLERIYLTVYDFNLQARQLYTKIGFVHEGTKRKVFRHQGQLHDAHIMAILRDEWQDIRRTGPNGDVV